MSERGYLDGVPLRLNSKYYPQPRPQFKEIDIHIPIDALQDDYDFSLERSVIVEVNAWEENKKLEDEIKLKEAIKQAEEKERIAEEARKKAEEDEKLRIEDEERRAEEEQQIQVESERLRIEEESRAIDEEEKLRLKEEDRRKQADEIKAQTKEVDALKPQDDEEAAVFEGASAVTNSKFQETSIQENSNRSVPNSDISGLTITPSNPNVSASARSPFRQGNVRNTRINLSDFESDTANPFDNVELNSINEMEVLASVLKNNSVSVPPNEHLQFSSDSQTNTNYGNGAPPSYGSCYPELCNQQYIYSNQQWNPNNYFVPGLPSAPEISGRLNQTPDTASTHVTNQSNIPASSANSFNKYYFPLLTSMADSRSMRDRQNQYSTNLNQGYHPQLPSTITNQTGSTCQNPFLNISHSPVQQFPILGSLSHSPSHNYWSDGNPMTVPATYNLSNHPPINGPLANETVHKSNNSHLPSSDLSSSTSNGTQPTLR